MVHGQWFMVNGTVRGIWYRGSVEHVALPMAMILVVSIYPALSI